MKISYLKDMNINFISLVKEPANGKPLILKNQGGFWKERKIMKFDEVKKIAYGIVYSPDQVDAQGDAATAEEIEKASSLFMKAKRTDNIDTEHTFLPSGVYVAENWITKANDPMFPTEPVGSWAVGLKVEDDKIWDGLKKGDYTGLSMAGTGKREVAEKGGQVVNVDSEAKKAAGAFDLLKALLGKGKPAQNADIAQGGPLTPEQIEEIVTKTVKKSLTALGVNPQDEGAYDGDPADNPMFAAFSKRLFGDGHADTSGGGDELSRLKTENEMLKGQLTTRKSLEAVNGGNGSKVIGLM